MNRVRIQGDGGSTLPICTGGDTSEVWGECGAVPYDVCRGDVLIQFITSAVAYGRKERASCGAML